MRSAGSCQFALVVLVLGVRPVAAQGTGRGAVELHVVAAETSQPLSFADVSIPAQQFSAFTDSAGTLVVRLLPAGSHAIRVRRVGFRPTVVQVAVVANETSRVRVVLPVIALRLASVKVSESLCPGDAAADTAVVTILQQARLNGERYAMLAERYPFAVSMERVFAQQGKVPIHWSGRARARRGMKVVQRHDTVQVTGRSEWRYSPGKLIEGVYVQYKDMDAHEKMTVPHLMDLSDEAFVSTHCFRYAGIVDAVRPRKVARVDFHPTRDIKDRDVRGSMYFDTATFQIVKTTLFAERPAPSAPATDTWQVRVDSWYREIRPGIPVIDRIESTTTISSTKRGPPNPNAVVEDHRALAVDFLRDEPGDAGLGYPMAQAIQPDGAAMSCVASPTAAAKSPADSVVLAFDDAVAKLCYGVSSDSLTLLLSREFEVAGVVLAPGRYTVRLAPNADIWLATFLSDSAAPVEVGRGEPTIERLAAFAPALTVHKGNDGTDVAFVVEWDSIRARIPVWRRR